jgi:hypothetical protein
MGARSGVSWCGINEAHGDMGALKTFLGLCALFVTWILVGILNIVLIETHSLSGLVVVTGVLTWMLMGPLWICLFLRWRRQRFIRAFNEMEENLRKRTRARLKDHSTPGPTR